MPGDDPLSRRDLLRGGFLGRVGRGAPPPGAAPPPGPAPGPAPRRFTLPVHRPPGAVDEASFLSGCTRCNECLAACPVGAIVLAPDRFRAAAGTPMIDPHASPCVLCPEAPCIAACKPGVLRPDRPRKMGVAWVQTMACLAHTGSFCTVCSERCPVPGAIEVTAGRPRIREEVCTGCGVCAHACPAPVNAIVVMPLADRPAPAAPGGRAGA